ncbi:uncharacterized protein LOC127094911 [Lathyrus oleraceus]|uniref:uncharacterized protein LOC127094911 n=1 Tax=Pisum sativum TaxID=3888 RepID=UPI0021CF5409|nr:uncharacterized protein LOC127094911 [Pisum sativum]
MEEYAYLLGIQVSNRVPFSGVEGILESRVIAEAIHLRKFDINANLTVKEGIRGNLVPTLLGDTYFYIHHWTSKGGGTIVYCAPLLYKLFIWHLPRSPISKENKGGLRWSQRIMSHTNDDVDWYSFVYNDVEIINSCGEFSNVPLLSRQGGINYNPTLERRQLRFSMKYKPNNTLLEGLFFQEGKDTQGLKSRMVKKTAKEFKIPYAYEKPMSLVMVESPTIKGIEELKEALDRMKPVRDDWEDKFHTAHLEKIELQKQLKEKDDLIELLEQHAVKRSRDQEDLFSSNSSSSTHLPTSGISNNIVYQLVIEKNAMKRNY